MISQRNGQVQQFVDDYVNFDEVTQEDESTCDSVDGSPMDGDVGKAFWFSKSSSEFVTSSYYCKRYDSYVRVVFAGGKIKGRRIYRLFKAVKVATMIAAVSGVKPPSGSPTEPSGKGGRSGNSPPQRALRRPSLKAVNTPNMLPRNREDRKMRTTLSLLAAALVGALAFTTTTSQRSFRRR